MTSEGSTPEASGASVLCLAEHDADGALEPSLRGLTLARSAAEQLGVPLVAMAVGEVSAAARDGLARYGVTDVYAVRFPGDSAYAPLAWARAAAGLAGRVAAAAVVSAGTDRGNEVMAHVGAITGEAMAAQCLSVSVAGDGRFEVTRHRWAGSLIEDAVLCGQPALLTVVPDAAPAVPASQPGVAAVHAWQPELSDSDLAVSVARTEEPEAGSVSLGEARVVVGGGRGLGSPEAFAALDELAAMLGGAVGVSRAVTSLGWRSHAQQVGQTGTKIAPELYLACGISGAIQHLAGCQAAKHVVAINTDGDAPIMKRADYAVIGDVNTVVPALVRALKDRQGAG